MEVNDLQSGRDLNFRVELTKLDLCAKFQLPSFSRDFRAHDLNFPCKWIPNATPPYMDQIKFELNIFCSFFNIQNRNLLIFRIAEKS